jgi:hypothetical protein
MDKELQELLDTLLPCEQLKLLHKGHRCDYFITNYGRVLNVNRFRTHRCKQPYKWMTVTPSTNTKTNYHQVRLPHTTIQVHREVGRFFLPDFSDDLLVCHKDESLDVPHLHSVWNLWMGTYSDNLKDAFDKGRKVMSNQHTVLRD